MPNEEAPTRLLLVDDHPVVREGLRRLLSGQADITCVGEAGSGDEALRRVRELKPDVVLLDLMMPGLDGLETLRRLRAAEPAVQVVMLSSSASEGQVRAAVDAGAIGYLLKDVLRDDLARAVRHARAGQPALHPQAQAVLMKRIRRESQPSPLAQLTARERDVLGAIARGRNNAAIAAELGLQPGTVKGHVSRIFEKLGVADRTQAALLAVREGLVPQEEQGHGR